MVPYPPRLSLGFDLAAWGSQLGLIGARAEAIVGYCLKLYNTSKLRPERDSEIDLRYGKPATTQRLSSHEQELLSLNVPKTDVHSLQHARQQELKWKESKRTRTYPIALMRRYPTVETTCECTLGDERTENDKDEKTLEWSRDVRMWR